MNLVRAGQLTIEQLAALYTKAFAGYLVPVRITPPILERMIGAVSIDLSSSWVAKTGDGFCGLVLVGRRGRQSRIASMGVISEARGQGIGRRLLEQALDDARARDDDNIRLECIEQNETALELYKSGGFVATRRLVGFEARGEELARPGPELEQDPEQVITALNIAESMFEHGPPRLPWQIDAAWLASYRGDGLALQLGHAQALVRCTDDEIAMRILWVPPPWRRQGAARRLIGHLAATYPSASWTIPALVPEEPNARFFKALGFRVAELSQVEMVKPVAHSMPIK